MRLSAPQLGLVVAALALIGVPLLKYATQEPPPLLRNGSAENQAIVEDVDAYWRETFAEHFPERGAAYRSPSVSFTDRIILYDHPLDDFAGVYTPHDQRIRISTLQGEMSIAHTIAHEFGHHVQYLSGIARDFERREALSVYGDWSEGAVLIELQAECLAGVWTADAAARGLLRRSEVDRMRLREALTQDSPTHGSALARVEWFDRGYESGRAADCASDEL